MERLERTFRSARVTSEATDATKADATKLSSFAEASPTPPTTGTSESHTRRETDWRRSSTERSEAQKGPADLTTWTKETEPAAVAYTPVRWPMPCIRPIGRSVVNAPIDMEGGVRTRLNHSKPATAAPTRSCAVAMILGRASAICACLFFTLYTIDNAYHSAK
jgi:hypothetical protein